MSVGIKDLIGQKSVDILAGLSRLNIRVTAIWDAFPTSRPGRKSLALETDAGPMVIKLFPPGMGWDTFDHMIRIWESSFGEDRSPPGLPRPIAFLKESNALVMERIAGYPMIERMSAGVERIEEVARTLADLHTSDASPSKRRDAKGVVRSIQRKVADLAGTGVEHHFAQVANRLEEWLPEVNRGEHGPVELVPSHGDFSPRNVIISPERIAFIDWDRFRLADPARDLAYFGAWAWMLDLRLRRKPEWTLGDRLVELYQIYHTISDIRERIRFYQAAGLARIAHSQVRLWKSTDLVLLLTAEALRLLA